MPLKYLCKCNVHDIFVQPIHYLFDGHKETDYKHNNIDWHTEGGVAFISVVAYACDTIEITRSICTGLTNTFLSFQQTFNTSTTPNHSGLRLN